MDWANITKIHIFPPGEHTLYKYNFVTGNIFSAPDAKLPLVLTKRSAASGDESAGNGRTIESHC